MKLILVVYLVAKWYLETLADYWKGWRRDAEGNSVYICVYLPDVGHGVFKDDLLKAQLMTHLLQPPHHLLAHLSMTTKQTMI